MDNKREEDNFSESLDSSTGIIDLGKIHCDSIGDVIKAPIFLELIGRVSQEMTDIVVGRLLSEEDFREIKAIYERVYVQGEKILSKEEYEILRKFIESDRVKEYFIKLLDEDHLRMSGAPKKTRKLTDDILKLNSNDKGKLTPIITYWLRVLDTSKKIGKDIIIGYNFFKSTKAQGRNSDSQRDDSLEIHSFKPDGEDTFGLILHQEGRVIESERSDYKKILDTHEFDGVKILIAEREEGQGYIAIIDGEIKEISDFGFSSIPTFLEENPCGAKKDTGKGMLYFDKNKGKVIELTSFDYTKIERQENSGVYMLTSQDGTKEVIQILSDGGVKESTKKSMSQIHHFHNNERLEKDVLIGRVQKEKLWGYLRIGDKDISEFSDQDYKNLPTFDKNTVEIGEKQSGKGLVEITTEGVVGVTGFDFTHIGDEEIMNGLIIRKAEKKTGEGLLYKAGGKWQETSFDIDTMWIGEGRGFWYPKNKKNEYICYSATNKGIEVFGNEYSNIDKRRDDRMEILLEKGNKKQLACKSKEGNIFFSKFEYLEIEEFDTRGFAIAKKENGYGLLKKKNDEISEVSNFDFLNLTELDDYRKEILEKESGKGVVNFSKQGIEELTGFEYISIEDFNTRGFAIAQKETGCGFLKSSQGVITEVTDFSYDKDSMRRIESEDYGIYEMGKEDGSIEFVSFSTKGFSKINDFDIEETYLWNQKGDIFYAKERGGNWAVMREEKGTIKKLSGFDYIDVIDCLEVDDGVTIFRRGTGYGYVLIGEHSFTELSGDFDFSSEDSDTIGNEGKYLAKKKDGGYGLIKYHDGKLMNLTNFDYDNRWNLESDEPQEVSRGGKKYIIRNTDNGVEIVTDLSQYTEIYLDIKEGNIAHAKKNSGMGFIAKKNGIIIDVSDFIYDEIGEMNDDNFVVTIKDGKKGILYFDEKSTKIIEVSIKNDDEAADGEGFIFEEIEIREEKKLRGSSLVVGTISGIQQIYRLFGNQLFKISEDHFTEVGYVDENGVIIGKDEKGEQSAHFIDYSAEKRRKGNMETLNKQGEHYARVYHIGEKWYIGEEKKDRYSILELTEGGLVKRTGLEPDLLSAEVIDGGIICGEKAGGFGYFSITEEGLKEISEFHYDGPGEINDIKPGEKLELRLKKALLRSGENAIIYFNGNVLQDVYRGDIDDIDLSSPIEDGELKIFKNTYGEEGAIRVGSPVSYGNVGVSMGEVSVEVVVKPEERNKKLIINGRKIVTKGLLFSSVLYQ